MAITDLEMEVTYTKLMSLLSHYYERENWAISNDQVITKGRLHRFLPTRVRVPNPTGIFVTVSPIVLTDVPYCTNGSVFKLNPSKHSFHTTHGECEALLHQVRATMKIHNHLTKGNLLTIVRHSNILITIQIFRSFSTPQHLIHLNKNTLIYT
jgi:hypothetical protein